MVGIDVVRAVRRGLPTRRRVWVPLLATLLPLLATTSLASAQQREHRLFDADWRFHLGEVPRGQTPALPDGTWRKLDLPHDWSIEGPYGAANASGTGFLPGGIGWYRKTFLLPDSLRGRRISVLFDGVYRNSTVWLNGKLLGTRPYGYSSFEYELTPLLRFGATPNVLAVRVDRSVVADSRWYPGTGIYRHVWLEVTGPLRVASWGTYVRTPVVNDSEALVSIETRVASGLAADARATLVTSILDERGNEVASTRTEESVPAGKEHDFQQQVVVPRPALWSPEAPHLYTAVSRVLREGALVDEQRTTFGMRSFYFSPDRGLVLNGRPVKLKGVCLHHDLGALGAAFFEEALERRLKSLKAIGVNALRTSHNPMAPEFYELADRMGFLVMDEAFDEWIGGKRKWAEGWNQGVVGRRGYNEFFEEWGVRDLQDMVRRDRNHPSIVLWSIGNEIDYPDDPFVHPRGRHDPKVPLDPKALKGPSANLMVPIARRLVAAIKELDATRPVTMALADIDASNATGVASMLDVTGYNYLEQYYQRDHQTYPTRVIYGSENSRSADAWRAVALNDFVGGQFLWTGVDYLGEAPRWPAHGSDSGLLDLQGFWKREAYFRQALWSARPMVYAVAWGAGADSARAADWPRNLGRVPASERWGWTSDPRRSIRLEIYSNGDSVEVLLNGRSLGVRPVPDRLLPALLWPVPNEAGEVEVVAWSGGAVSARFSLSPVGAGERLELTPDLTRLQDGARQVATVEVHVLDRAGHRVPDADQTVSFEVSGAGRLLAAGNGNLSDTTSVQAGHTRLHQGRAIAIVRSGAEPGTLTLRATAPGLKPAEVTLTVER